MCGGTVLNVGDLLGHTPLPALNPLPAERTPEPAALHHGCPPRLQSLAMEQFTKLFGKLLVFVYHCFDRIVIHGYLSGLSRPEYVVHFFRQVAGIPVLTKEVLSQ